MNIKRELVDHSALLQSLKLAIKNPSEILTKRTINGLTNTLMREALGTFLIAEALNYSSKLVRYTADWSVCKNLETDSLDGYLHVYNIADGTSNYFEFEQVMLTIDDKSVQCSTDIAKSLLDKIHSKHTKRYANSEKVILIIFLDVLQNVITPEIIKNLIKKEGTFGFYFTIILDAEKSMNGKYVYTVIPIDPSKDGHSRIHIEINDDFKGYEVFEDNLITNKKTTLLGSHNLNKK